MSEQTTMASDRSAQSTTVWSLPQVHFEVKWDNAVVRLPARDRAPASRGAIAFLPTPE